MSRDGFNSSLRLQLHVPGLRLTSIWELPRQQHGACHAQERVTNDAAGMQQPSARSRTRLVLAWVKVSWICSHVFSSSCGRGRPGVGKLVVPARLGMHATDLPRTCCCYSQRV